MKKTGRINILFIEDDPNDVELTIRELKKHNLGEDVHVVKDGKMALEYIFATDSYAYRNIEDTPRVIILDLRLPKVDGLEVLRKIRGDERTKKIPVIVVTSSQEEKDMIESYKLNVFSYLTKPLDFEKLILAISQSMVYTG